MHTSDGDAILENKAYDMYFLGDIMVIAAKLRIAFLVTFSCLASTVASRADPFIDMAKRGTPENKIYTYTNHVGCVETVVPSRINGGAPGAFSFHFRVPRDLRPELLTNTELSGCGLEERPPTAVPGTAAYTAWSLLVHKEMKQPEGNIWKPDLEIGRFIEGPPPRHHVRA